MICVSRRESGNVSDHLLVRPKSAASYRTAHLTAPMSSARRGSASKWAHSGRGALAAGTYYLDDRYFINASRLTFTVPAGWTAEDYGELYTLLAGRLVRLPR
jgi:hypothetical protein